MNIQYMTKDVELNEYITSYAEEKVAVLEKLVSDTGDEISVEIELQKEQPPRDGYEYRADITIHAGGLRMHAVGRGENLNAAIDTAKDELERRLRRDKRKRLTLFKRGARKIKEMLRFGR